MRSRYSAFCQGNLDYLVATHHPAQQAPDERAALQKTVASTQWVNLKVVQTQQGKAKDKTGVVEFVAAYRPKTAAANLLLMQKEAGQGEALPALEQLHERSRFVKEQGQWFYTEGDMLPPYVPKPGQPCWCGSGKKYKQCHR